MGVCLHICQKTTSSALLPLLRAVCHWFGVLPDGSCASREVPVSSASHLTRLVLEVHTTIPALYGPGNPNSGLRAFEVY